MRETDSDNSTKRQYAKKLTALTVCAVFIIGSVLSQTFILSHINHEHDRGGPNKSCSTCAHLTAVENLSVKLPPAPSAAFAPVFGCLFAVNHILNSVNFHTVTSTLVNLKIKLSD